MGNLFVKFDIAVSANLAGFKEECFAYYHTNQIDKELNFMHHNQDGNSIIPIKHPNILKVHDALSAPTIQQLTNWFENTYRIKLNSVAEFDHSDKDFKYNGNFSGTIEFLDKKMIDMKSFSGFKSSNDALSKVIEEAFKEI
jgi:hypothetical protein